MSGDGEEAHASWVDQYGLECIGEAWSDHAAMGRPERVFPVARRKLEPFAPGEWIAVPEHLQILTKEEVDRLRREHEDDVDPTGQLGARNHEIWFPRTPRDPYDFWYR